MARVLLALLPLSALAASSCDLLCDSSSYEAYVFDEQHAGGQITGGQITGLSGSALTRQGDVGGVGPCVRHYSQGDTCGQIRFCLESETVGGTPALALCLSLEQAHDGARFTLPDPEVTVDAKLGDGSDLRVDRGLLRLAISRGQLEASFDLELTADGGQPITVRGGRYAWIGGHTETRCLR